MSVDADLVRLLKRLKLGQLVPTLPERLALARAQQLDYAQFLTLLLADEVQRREQQALERHLLQAGFEERITLDDFDWSAPIQLDRRQLQHVFTLQFLERKEHVLVVGPTASGRHSSFKRWGRRRCAPARASCSCGLTSCSESWARRAPTTPLRRRSAAI